MSGSTGLNAPSYMPALMGSASQGSSLLAALSGYSGRDTAAATIAASAPVGGTGQSAIVAGDPRVQSDIAQFSRAVGAARSPAELLADPVALKVLLTANGLGDQVSHASLATRALLADPSRSDSLVNQLPDPRWLAVNKAYAFAAKGLQVVSTPAAIGKIASGYAEVMWRNSLNQTTPGLSTALDFRQRAATIGNVDQVLADPTFRAVVSTGPGLGDLPVTSQSPGNAALAVQSGSVVAATGRASRDNPGGATLRQAIAGHLDLTRFQDPAFVSQFTARYLNATGPSGTRSAVSATPDRTARAARSAGLVV